MSDSRTVLPTASRWSQLAIGIVCMVMIANLQYGWTLFVTPIDQKYHWGRAAIQVAFSIFVLTETWLVPIVGWFVDRFGPKDCRADWRHRCSAAIWMGVSVDLDGVCDHAWDT